MAQRHLSDWGSPTVSWTSASLHHNSAHDGNLNVAAGVVIISRSLSLPQALRALRLGPAESSIGTDIACTSKTLSQMVQVPVSRLNPDLLYLKLGARRRQAQNRSKRTRRMGDIQRYMKIDAAPERVVLLTDSRAALQILSNLLDAPPIAHIIAFKIESLEKNGWTKAYYGCHLIVESRAMKGPTESQLRHISSRTALFSCRRSTRPGFSLHVKRKKRHPDPGVAGGNPPPPVLAKLTFTASWLYHIKCVDSPNCQTCQVPEDIEHLLCDGSIFDAQRSRLHLELRQIGAAKQSLSHLLFPPGPRGIATKTFALLLTFLEDTAAIFTIEYRSPLIKAMQDESEGDRGRSAKFPEQRTRLRVRRFCRGCLEEFQIVQPASAASRDDSVPLLRCHRATQQRLVALSLHGARCRRG
ncbi:hypothetical protein HPB47_012409 [Ixodes persulcatus]|uniref:Uncharacterized protein n=1 Tax=Ixodes persulcatus TaxID=34615 RepID=A0AC60NTM6_IXOPE|nr:hypothetical protein HPB47_012409 [Ixodes persulcatus]